uniref:site-specific integrase n=1 Tax=Paractinoplanes polyasparticus TaxID=2856853 RepID=UPI001C8618EC|nr:tyrosine-type recombinase/integrase [Actinoplanes polyasparticus]
MLPEDDKITVTQWLRQWLVNQAEVRDLRDNTIDNYRRDIENVWIPRIGKHKLLDLRAHHVTKALREHIKERNEQISSAVELNARYEAEAAAADQERQRAGRKRPVKPKHVVVPRPFGPATANRAHATLRAALNAAMRMAGLPRNVAVLADKPTERRRKVRPWTPEQLGSWLDAIEEHPLYPLFHLSSFAGLRRGELCGLGWDEVDLNAGRLVPEWQITAKSYLTARRANKEGHKISYRTRLKTGDSEATPLDLDAVTVEVLRNWRREQTRQRLKMGRAYRNDENLVFTRADGSPHDPTQVTKIFKRLIRQPGLRNVPLHNLRHMAASIQIEAGVDISVVSKRMRHSKIGLTSDTYGHLIGSVGKAAAEAAAAIVPRRQAG